MSVDLSKEKQAEDARQVQAQIIELNIALAALELDHKELWGRLTPVTRSEVKELLEEKEPHPNLVPIALDLYTICKRVNDLVEHTRDILQVLEI